MRKKLSPGTLLAPVPAVLVTCKYGDKINMLTVAWTGIVCTKPAMTYVSIRPERYSYDLIDKSGEFVINLTTTSMAKAVDFCGVRSGRDINKAEICGFELSDADIVNVPLIAQSPLCLECRVVKKEKLGSHDMFLAQIVSVSVDEKYIGSNGKIKLEQCGLLAYAHGDYNALGRNVGNFGFSVKKRRKGKK
ncbi:MAG: flavin reductase family protein [Oscillospiraceae bacterium]|nr:flavin reductase family protein [Oscillospiraceae bacterium]